MGDQGFKTMTDHSAAAPMCGFKIDEDNDVCSRAETNAKTVINYLKQYDPKERKQKKLPLQGDPWKKFSIKDKEESKLKSLGDSNIETYKDDLRTEKNKCRLQQKNTEISDAMKCFLQSISVQDNVE